MSKYPCLAWGYEHGQAQALGLVGGRLGRNPPFLTEVDWAVHTPGFARSGNVAPVFSVVS